MATTFTILAVFLPVGFMTGIVGQFFKSFALTIAFAVAMSLLVAFTLDPMLSSRFVRLHSARRSACGRASAASSSAWGRLYDSSTPAYHRLLRWSLGTAVDRARHRGAVDLRRQPLRLFGVIGTEFVPAEDRGQFQVLVDLPPGTSFDESVATVARIEQIVRTGPGGPPGLQHGRSSRRGRGPPRCR